ncbi:MAG: 23S rRNA (adenine(2503)-C(2))-methyltransferase RlmN [Bacilli bacterium]
MRNIYGITRQDLEKEMLALGQKTYRAKQLFTWLYQKNAQDFGEMSDVAKAFRVTLKTLYYLHKPTIFTKQQASDGTIKLLLEMEDGAKVETVLMRYEYGNSLCVSCQVGCSMSCTFCASGLLKKQRNLTAAEMLGQVMVMNDLLREEQTSVSHIVVMGTGEPFDNYTEVLNFIRICNDPHALNIGARHITVSTCGIPDKIRQYANEGLQVNLAISLHASNNYLRSQIMPINRVYPLEELMEAIRYYEKTSSRRVTFEYIMLKDFNDRVEQAKELAKLLKGLNAYVNLIPYNEVEGLSFFRSLRENVNLFMDTLKNSGVNVTVRKEFGHDIDAACGQLRAKRS